MCDRLLCPRDRLSFFEVVRPLLFSLTSQLLDGLSSSANESRYCEMSHKATECVHGSVALRRLNMSAAGDKSIYGYSLRKRGFQTQHRLYIEGSDYILEDGDCRVMSGETN